MKPFIRHSFPQIAAAPQAEPGNDLLWSESTSNFSVIPSSYQNASIHTIGLQRLALQPSLRTSLWCWSASNTSVTLRDGWRCWCTDVQSSTCYERLCEFGEETNMQWETHNWHFQRRLRMWRELKRWRHGKRKSGRISLLKSHTGNIVSLLRWNYLLEIQNSLWAFMFRGWSMSTTQKSRDNKSLEERRRRAGKRTSILSWYRPKCLNTITTTRKNIRYQNLVSNDQRS